MDFGVIHIAIFIFLGIGGVFGWLTSYSAFCQSGAVYDWVMAGNPDRLKAWFIAAATAAMLMLGLELAGWTTVDDAVQRAASLPLGRLVLGGLLFGIGMGLARACPSRLLVRAGRGQLSGMFGLFILALSGVVFYAYANKWLGAWIVQTTVPLPVSQSVVSLLAHYADISSVGVSVGLLCVLGVGVWFGLRALRKHPHQFWGALVLGILIAFAWGVSGSAFFDAVREEAAWGDVIHKGLDVRGISFIGPVRGTLEWGIQGFSFELLSLGVALCLGVLMGAVVQQLRYGWRIQNDMQWLPVSRQIIGSTLLSGGGLLALGCSVGQGLSGIAVLSLGSVVALFFMLVGAMAVHRIERIWFYSGEQTLKRRFLAFFKVDRAASSPNQLCED